MKPVLASVAVAVLAVIAVTVWVGARVREDTVVANPYEEGQKLNGSPAGAAAGGHDHHATGPEAPAPSLTLSPRPLHTLRELEVEVRWPGPATEVTVSFAMAGMDMGENTARLVPAGDGLYRGKAVLVRCPSGRRDWTATVRVKGSAPAERTFPLVVEE
jgi:hypothetical protein